MDMLYRLKIALLTLALSACGAAGAASTTNFSDQWWNADESGWGASILQQRDVLFVDLFVYGSDGKPTWFTAAASHQGTNSAGHQVFSGTLNQTVGPYYGGAFDPAAVGYRAVGTLTFEADTVSSATLSYSVDGTQIVKRVTRQLWRFENIAGDYLGGLVVDTTGCVGSTGTEHVEFTAFIRITHATDNAATIVFELPGSSSCTLAGAYTQAGHMGAVTGRLSCAGEPGSSAATAFEIERSISAISGRFTAASDPGGDNCKSVGRFGGVLR